MAHKTLEDGRKVVDWTTGDPEGDRVFVMAAYRDFFKELLEVISNQNKYTGEKLTELIDKWQVDTENQIDDVPRVWIKRPEHENSNQ